MDGPLSQCTCTQVHYHTATVHSHMKDQSIEWAKLLTDQTRLYKRHYTKCKPSRRKSPLRRGMAEVWAMQLSRLAICLQRFVDSGICTHFFRSHRTKQSGVPLRFWVIIFWLAMFVPSPLCEADPHLQPSSSSESDIELHNVIAPVGSAFVYTIPERAFGCKVDKLVVSETADRFLSTWLAYNDDKRQVYGVPSEKDLGTFDIFVVALAKSEIENVGTICGSKSFAITVISISDEVPVSVKLADPSRTDTLQFQQTEAATDMLCTPGNQVVLATVIVSVSIDSLNGHERMTTILKMAQHLNTSTRNVSMFSGESRHPLILQLEGPSLLIAGAGDGRFVKGPKSSLTWRISCGAIGLKDAALSQLETSTQDGTISGLLGFPVVSWHVMSGSQKSVVRRRVRRNVGGRCPGCTPTPSTSSAPPTRISSISTTMLVNKSSVITRSLTPAASSTVLSRSMTPATVVSTALPTSVTQASELPESTLRPLTTAVISPSGSSSASVSHVSLTTNVQVGISLSSSPRRSSQLSSPAVTRSFTTTNLSSVEITQTTSRAHNTTSVVVSTSRGTILGKNTSTRASSAAAELTSAPSQSALVTLNSTERFLTSTSVSRNATLRKISSSVYTEGPSTTSPASILPSKSSQAVTAEIPSSVITSSSTVSNATSVISLIPSSAVTLNVSDASSSFVFTTTTVRSLVVTSVSAVKSTTLPPSSSMAPAATKSTSSAGGTVNATALPSALPSLVTPMSTVALPSWSVDSSVIAASSSSPGSLLMQSSSVVRRNQSTIFTLLASTQTVRDSSSTAIIVQSRSPKSSNSSTILLASSASKVVNSTSELQSVRTNTIIVLPSGASSLKQLVTSTFSVSHSRSVLASLSIPSNTTSKPSRSTQVTVNSTLDSHRPTTSLLTPVRPSRTYSLVTRLTLLIPNATLGQSATRSLDSSSVPVSVKNSSVVFHTQVSSTSMAASSMPIRSSSVGENSTLESRSRNDRIVTSVQGASSIPSTLQSSLIQSENPSTFTVSSRAASISSSAVLSSPSSAQMTGQTSLTGSSVSVTFSSESGNTSTLTSSTPVVTNSTHVTPGTLAVTPTLPATRNVSIATTSTTGFVIDSTGMIANRTAITHSLPLISTPPALSTRTAFVSFTRSSAMPARSFNVSRVSTVTRSELTNVSTSTMSFKTSAKTSSATETLSSPETAFSSSPVDSKTFNSTAVTAVDSSTVVRDPSSLISLPVSLTTESFIPTDSRTSSMINSTSRISAPSTSFELVTITSSEKRGTTYVVTRTIQTSSALISSASLSTSALNVSSSLESTQVTNTTADSKTVISTRTQSAITRNSTPVLESTARTLFLVSPSSLATSRVGANLTSLRATHSTVTATRSSLTAVSSSSPFGSKASTQPVETSLSTIRLKSPSSGSVTPATNVTSKTQTSSRTAFITATTAPSITGTTETANSTAGLFSPSVLVNQTSGVLTPVTTAKSFDVTSLTTDVLTNTVMTSASLSRNASVFTLNATAALSTKAVTTPRSTSVIITSSPSLNTSVSQSRIVTQGTTSLGVPSAVLTSTVTATNSTSLTPTPATTVRPTTAPANTGPVLVNNLGRVTAWVGKALDYPIPNDTFYDKEDGGTWNLKLRVAFLDNKSIPANYWLQFDPIGRRLYGLPSQQDAEDHGADSVEFVLVATDNGGKNVYDAFDVLIDTDSPPVVQQLRIRTVYNYSKFNANVSLRLLLLDKIATYYGDPDNTHIRVLSISPGSVNFVWTNDSLPTSECDVETVDNIANKLLLEDGAVKPEFKTALKPEFPVLTADEARFGACNASYVTPTDPILGKASKSIDDLWYMHVLTGILVVVLLIIIAVLLVRLLRRKKPKPFKPEKKTYKKRKPIILNPEIELKEFPGKPLVLPNDDPSQPPSYMSETSLDRSPRYYYSDEDEEDAGTKRSPSPPMYEPPPPFYPAMDEPRKLPPPIYALPPLFPGKYLP